LVLVLLRGEVPLGPVLVGEGEGGLLLEVGGEGLEELGGGDLHLAGRGLRLALAEQGGGGEGGGGRGERGEAEARRGGSAKSVAPTRIREPWPNGKRPTRLATWLATLRRSVEAQRIFDASLILVH